MPGVLRCQSRLMERCTNALMLFGGTFEFKGPWFSNFDFIITSNPMNINHILSRKFDNYDKGPGFRETFRDALGEGILNAPSHSWKGQRKMLMSLMHSSKFVRRMEQIVCQKLEKGLIPMLDHFVKFEAEVDLQDVFQRFNYDNVCLLVVGFNPNSLLIEFPHVPTKVAFNHAEEALLYRHMVPISFWKLQKWLQIREEKKMSKALDILDDFAYQCISLKREKLKIKSEADQEDEFDLLSAIMAENNVEMSGFEKSGDRFLRDILISLLGAGKDAVSASLSWFFWLVATNPSVESKFYKRSKLILQTN